MEENLFYREGYLERIKPFIGKHIIKILTGQRRVGKSYMLKLIIEEIKKSENANIIYIDKEQERFSEINNHIQLYNYVKNKLSNGTGIRQLHLREFLKQNEFKKMKINQFTKEEYLERIPNHKQILRTRWRICNPCVYYLLKHYSFVKVLCAR